MREAFLLFLTVCQHAEARDALVRTAALPGFVNWIVKRGERRDIETMVSVIRRMNISSPEFVVALDQIGFFGDFVTRCMEDEDMVETCIMLLDKLARVVWVNGFKKFIDEVPKIFAKRGPVAQKALIAVIVVARYPEAREPLLEAGMVDALKNFELTGNYQGYKEDLLTYLTKGTE
jgi:hypothetical protein